MLVDCGAAPVVAELWLWDIAMGVSSPVLAVRSARLLCGAFAGGAIVTAISGREKKSGHGVAA